MTSEREKVQQIIDNHYQHNRWNRVSSPEAIAVFEDDRVIYFKSLTNLKYYLEEIFDHFRHLKDIKLIHSDVSTLPHNISNLRQLVRIDISYCQLSSLPEEVGDLPKLRYLDVKYNRLTELPPTIGTLHNLIHLNLSHNRIESLPKSIQTYPN